MLDVMKEKLFEYVSAWFVDGRSERTVCQGSRSFVEQFIPRDEFAALFGGFCRSDGRDGKEFLGVWGRRKCQHFRRLLRERGAVFELVKENPGLQLRMQYSERI
jgi:hypothetical protein